MKFNAIISGGGTGGHIFPAISIANKIKELYPESEILFVGALGKMEMERVPAAGYRIIGLPVAGLQRKALLKNVKFPFKLWKSVRGANKIVKEFQPHVAIGVGGFASGPLLWAAARRGVPCLIQEQNSYAGITNKLLAKKAKVVCVAYAGMERFFPKEKIVLTGTPVRSAIKPVTPSLQIEGRAHFGIDPSKKCILIVGGSLGARTLNDCVKDYIERSGGTSEVELIWQCGDYYRKEIEEFVSIHPLPWVHLHPFIQRIDLAFAAADVVISRAGAGTVAELCIAGKATIFVPSPNVSEDHQTHNAMALVRMEAALIVPEKQAPTQLMRVAIELANDPPKRALLEANIALLARPNATQEIVGEIINIMRTNE